MVRRSSVSHCDSIIKSLSYNPLPGSVGFRSTAEIAESSENRRVASVARRARRSSSKLGKTSCVFAWYSRRDGGCSGDR